MTILPASLGWPSLPAGETLEGSRGLGSGQHLQVAPLVIMVIMGIIITILMGNNENRDNA